MRYPKLFLFAVILLITCPAFAQVSIPEYKTVVEKFFDQYTLTGIEDNSDLYFEKHPDGWYVTIQDYSLPPKMLKKEIFWDRKKNEYKSLSFAKTESPGDNNGMVEKYIYSWAASQFALSPYYGYPGWDMDVIKEYGSKKELSDSMLYALGRAYSSFASNLLNSNSGLADPKEQFILKEGKNTLTKEQLAKYREYRHLAIETYNKLASRNPKFETVIGEIGIKASNEYLTAFLDLRQYQNEEEAKKELKAGLYNEFYIAMAKNYLNSCDQNAILLTNGDNDTYPLLYVQSQFGFRTDVLVVNLSLLQTDRYINNLREGLPGSEKLPVSFTPEQIKGPKREVVIIDNASQGPLNLKEIIAFVQDDKNVKDYGTVSYPYIPTNAFLLESDKKVMSWTLSDSYILKNQLIVLDILAATAGKRPVYYAISVGSEVFLGLDDYFAAEGLAYRVSPDKKDSVDYYTGYTDMDKLYENLMKKFDYSGINKLTTYDKLTAINYRNCFTRLAEALIKNNRTDDGLKVLAKCLELFPDEMLSYDHYMLGAVESYFRAGKFEQGSAIAKIILKNMDAGKNNFLNQAGFDKQKYIEYITGVLEMYAKTYNQPDLLKR
jgi:hypothetical protein